MSPKKQDLKNEPKENNEGKKSTFCICWITSVIPQISHGLDNIIRTENHTTRKESKTKIYKQKKVKPKRSALKSEIYQEKEEP